MTQVTATLDVGAVENLAIEIMAAAEVFQMISFSASSPTCFGEWLDDSAFRVLDLIGRDEAWFREDGSRMTDLMERAAHIARRRVLDRVA